MKREVWPGGPEVGQVLEAQLSPAGSVPSSAAAGSTAVPSPTDTLRVNLLLLLR